MVKKIDVERVIIEKNSNLHKILPNFIIKYIKKIVHEEDLNEILDTFGHLNDFEFVSESLNFLDVKHQIINPQYIEEAGRSIIASNHPLGGPDGLIMMDIIGKFRRDIRFIANDILSNIENIKGLLLPVNKHGASPRNVIKMIDEFYASDYLIFTFPFGLVSRKRKGVIQDLVWHKSFVTKAKKHNRFVIPIHFSGRNSNFFYNLSNIRRFLKIKSNIEMFFLSNEMFKQRGNTFTITVGEPIDSKYFDNRFTDLEWAEHLRKYIYELAKNPDLKFKV